MTYQPYIYIDAHRLAEEIRRAPVKPGCLNIAGDRHIDEIEDELSACFRNCHLTLKAVDVLREMVKGRKIDCALSDTNANIVTILANAP